MMVEVEIDNLAFGGAGVGRQDGKAVFVPLTAPGDRVAARIVREHKRYAEAEVVTILAPSPLRRSPPCPVFGDCGGCQWQHLPYDEQCRWKERIIGDLLRRQGGIADPPLRPLAPAPDEWHYRSRVQFKCRLTDGGVVMGFYRRGSHFVVDVGHCPITAAPLNAALRLFRQWLPASPCPAEIPQVDLECGDDGAVRAVVHVIGRCDRALADYLRPLAEGHGLSLFLQSGRKETLQGVCGEADLMVRVGDPPLDLAYGPGGFAQVNLPQNRRLVEEVVTAAALAGGERILDLFCGMGNFSLPLARGGGEVTGVEGYPPAIDQARRNARRLGIESATFHARPAEGAAGSLAAGRPWDLVVLDPPRSGAYGVARELVQVRPRRILYVSCDPPTLARDLQPLLHGGYRLLWLRPLDLFPQTSHLESVCLLERIDAGARSSDSGERTSRLPM